MITGFDIENAFIKAQNRIDTEIDKAQFQFNIPDLVLASDVAVSVLKGKVKQNKNNPLQNEVLNG